MQRRATVVMHGHVGQPSLDDFPALDDVDAIVAGNLRLSVV